MVVRDDGGTSSTAIPTAESTPMTDTTPATAHHIELTETYAAHNYHPLPRGARRPARAPGSPTSTGKRYLDCLAGYSALNFGHGHPRLVARRAASSSAG